MRISKCFAIIATKIGYKDDDCRFPLSMLEASVVDRPLNLENFLNSSLAKDNSTRMVVESSDSLTHLWSMVGHYQKTITEGFKGGMHMRKEIESTPKS